MQACIPARDLDRSYQMLHTHNREGSFVMIDHGDPFNATGWSYMFDKCLYTIRKPAAKSALSPMLHAISASSGMVSSRTLLI